MHTELYIKRWIDRIEYLYQVNLSTFEICTLYLQILTWVFLEIILVWATMVDLY